LTDWYSWMERDLLAMTEDLDDEEAIRGRRDRENMAEETKEEGEGERG